MPNLFGGQKGPASITFPSPLHQANPGGPLSIFHKKLKTNFFSVESRWGKREYLLPNPMESIHRYG
jgi:hypothetical protein